MDIYEYIKADHEYIAHLFKQFDNSDLPVRQRQIIELIAQELMIHAHAEQKTFYKVLMEFPQTKDNALHGKKEHQQIEEQINNILLKNEDVDWYKNIKKFRELVEHHVKEEENNLFKKAKQFLSVEDAYNLKEKMHYMKFLLITEMN